MVYLCYTHGILMVNPGGTNGILILHSWIPAPSHIDLPSFQLSLVEWIGLELI